MCGRAETRLFTTWNAFFFQTTGEGFRAATPADLDTIQKVSPPLSGFSQLKKKNTIACKKPCNAKRPSNTKKGT